jgi:hypothetical protein
MQVLNYLQNVLDACSKLVKFGAGIQNRAREELVADLQTICSNCEKSYSQMLVKLRPVKDSYQDTAALAKALRDFASDPEARAAFHPHSLCGDVDKLLFKLRNNLDPLKYSVDVRKIDDLRRELQLIGNYDGAIYASFDEFAGQLDNLSTELQGTRPEAGTDRKEYVRHVIDDFEEELSRALESVRAAKGRILH